MEQFFTDDYDIVEGTVPSTAAAYSCIHVIANYMYDTVACIACLWKPDLSVSFQKVQTIQNATMRTNENLALLIESFPMTQHILYFSSCKPSKNHKHMPLAAPENSEKSLNLQKEMQG